MAHTLTLLTRGFSVCLSAYRAEPQPAFPSLGPCVCAPSLLGGVESKRNAFYLILNPDRSRRVAHSQPRQPRHP
eukprot:scaffold12086_cov67-Phaeocystis_antarctica.AAC.11